MTAQKWDYLPPGWSVRVEPGETPTLFGVLQADVIWRNLTKPQRELLLSTAAGFPIVPGPGVAGRLTGRGLIDAGGLTDAGRFVVRWRIHPQHRASVEAGESA